MRGGRHLSRFSPPARDWNDPAEARRNWKGQVVLRIRHDGRSHAEADRDGGVSGRRIALAKLGDGPIGMGL